jgi:hypothetical protein
VNIHQAHIQTAIWKTALDSRPPALDPAGYGWERDERTRCVTPVTQLPEVPDMITYGSTTDTPCLTAMCGCLAVKS